MNLKKLLFCLFLIGFQSVLGQLYVHDFGTTTITTHPYTIAPITFDANLNGSSWTNSTAAWTSFAGSAGQALSLANSSGTPTITLNFNVTSGYNLNITSFSFWRQRSAAGAPNWSMTINGISAGSGTAPTTGANTGSLIVSNPVNNLSGAISVVISLSGASGAGTFRLDDFTLNGSVVSSAITSAQNGDWYNPTSWVGGVVPSATQNVVIAHNISNTTFAPAAITRNIGTTTTVNGLLSTGAFTYTNNGATTINGTFQLDNGGWATGNNFVYGATGTLNFNSNTSYGVNNTDSFWPSSNAPFNINVLQGGLTLNNCSRTVNGTFATAAAVVLNTATLTLNGFCQINSGGYFSNTPTYGNASTLVYNNVGNYANGTEWTGGASTATTAGFGVPANVTIQQTSNITLAGGRGLPGNLTIANVNAVLTLNSSAGDFYLGGNLIQNGGSGGLINNLRGFYFVLSNNQTIAAAVSPVYFDYLRIQKPSGNVQLTNTDVTVNTTAGDVFQLLDLGSLDLNGKSLTFNNNGGVLKSNGTSRRIFSSLSNAKININGNKTVDFFNPTDEMIFDTNITMHVSNCAIDFGFGKSFINGNLQLNGSGNVANYAPIYGNTSKLIYWNGFVYGRNLEWSAVTTDTFPSKGYPNDVQIGFNTVLDLGANGGSGAERAINGSLTIDDGSTLDMAGANTMQRPLNVKNNVVVGQSATATLTLSTVNGADLKMGGNLSFNGTYSFFPNNRAVIFTKNGTQTISASTPPTIPYIVFSPSSGNTVLQLQTNINVTAPLGGNGIALGGTGNVFDLFGKSLTLGTNGVANLVSSSGGIFKGNVLSNLTLNGSGSLGTITFGNDFNLNNLTINRNAATIAVTLGSNITINGLLTLTNGLVDLVNFNMTLGSAATISGGGTNSFVIADATSVATGKLQKIFSAANSFIFPIGDNAGTPEFSPATISFASGTFPATVGVSVSDKQHPNNSATTDFLTRFWSVSTSMISPNYSFSGTFLPADISGNINNYKTGRWDGSSWTDISATTVVSPTLSLSSLTNFSTTNDFSCGEPLSPPEINLLGNNTNIVSGSLTTSLTNFTDFGSIFIGNTITKQFKIQNLGGTTLNLTGTPKVSLSGSASFVVSIQPTAASIAAGGFLTFDVVYAANLLSVETATLSIANDDSNENPYTFVIKGIGVPNNLSDVIDNTNYATTTPEFNSNINYINFIDATSSITGKMIPMKLKIRDGGATLNDLDTENTVLSGIKFTVKDNTNTDRLAFIKTAILTTSAGTVIATATKVGTELVFASMSGTSVTADDNTEKILHLRVSFDQTQVVDNTKLIFAVSSVTAASGSAFAAPNGGAASSDISNANDRNRIEVTADRLLFTTQPALTTAINVAMPNVVLTATDLYSLTDFDFVSPVALTSTGTMTGTPVTTTAVLGVATFGTITHTVAGSPLYLNATSSGLLAYNLDSNAFNITAIVYINGDYRTTGTGSWTSNTASPAIWERHNGTTFLTSNSPAFNTANNIYIENGHTITSGGSFANSVNIKVKSGGSFINTASSTAASIYIYAGGSFTMTGALTINGNFEIEDNGTFNFNNTSFSASSLSSSLWKGNEIFHPNSNFIIKNHGTSTADFFIPAEIDVATNTYNGFTACFGNLIFDSIQTATFPLLGSSFTKNLTHKDFVIRSATFSSNAVRLTSNSITTTIGGSLIMEAGNLRNLNFSTAGITGTITVLGDVTNASTKTLTVINNATGNMTFNVNGNLNSSNTGSILLNGTTGGVSVTNLKGDLTIGNTATLYAAATSGTTFNFNATGDGLTAATTQTIDVDSFGIATRNQYIDFFVKNSAYVQLLNRDFELGKNSTFTVNGSGAIGGILDFNFFSGTALNITSYSTGTAFTSQQASTLKISNIAGISATSGTVGNVQVTNAPTYNNVATFHYIGKNNQNTGTGLPSASSGKIVIVELLNNNTTLTLINTVGISNNIVLNTLGGRLEIRKGIVLGTSTADFTGSGRLVMTDGEYRISTITATPLSNYLPQLSNYANYALTGGIVNLSGTNAIQILSGTPNYYNFTTSGTNIYNVDYKGISSATSVQNDINVSQTSILDVKTHSMGGTNTNLYMTGTGRYITDGAGDKPDATGVYSFAPNTTVEFNNNSGAGVVKIASSATSPILYANVVVSGTNVANKTTNLTSGLQFQPNGTFTVKSGATFKLSNTNGFSGSSTTAIKNTNIPIITLETGSNINYVGGDQVLTPKAQATDSDYYNLTISGSATKTLTATTEVLVANDLNLASSTLQIDTDKMLTVTNGLNNTSGAPILIKNGGNLVQINEVPTTPNAGNITMTRTTRSMIKNDYVYWGQPVKADATHNYILANFSTVYNKNYSWQLTNAADGAWVATSQTYPGKGFISRVSLSGIGVQNIDFTNGEPNNGIITLTTTELGNVYAADPTNPNLSGNAVLLANPYPSALDAEKFVSWATNNNLGDGTLYFWTSKTPHDLAGATYTDADYASWNITGGVATAPPPSDPLNLSLKPTGKIAAGQGFFVRKNNDADITFNNSMRLRSTTNANNLFFRNTNTEPEKHRIWLNLTNGTNSFRQTLVGYISGATNALEPLYDGQSYTANNIDFYSVVSDAKLVIQGRSLPFNDTDMVPLGCKITTPGNYSIAIDEVDGLLAGNQNIYLEDLLLNITHDLKTGAYNFATDTGTFDNRFVLKYNDLPLASTQFEIANHIIAFSNNQNLTIKSQKETIAKITIYDVLGREIVTKNPVNQTEVILQHLTKNAVFIAKITLQNGIIVSKKVLIQ